jgi:hypothetical protein
MLFDILKQSGVNLNNGSAARWVSASHCCGPFEALDDNPSRDTVRPFPGGAAERNYQDAKDLGLSQVLCAFAGLGSLRLDDYGPLWEHIVLEYLLAM